MVLGGSAPYYFLPEKREGDGKPLSVFENVHAPVAQVDRAVDS